MANNDETGSEAAKGRQIAVALAYRPDQEGDAPKVVATGRGAVAQRILELAFANGVKVREDPDLAQVLAAVDIDSVVPLEAFMAVAEILAHVYKANHQPVPQPAAATGESRQ